MPIYLTRGAIFTQAQSTEVNMPPRSDIEATIHFDLKVFVNCEALYLAVDKDLWVETSCITC